MQKAEVGIAISVAAALSFVAAGCTDRSSPATPTASIKAAANDGDSATSTSDTVAAKTPDPTPAKPNNAAPEQLASASSAEEPASKVETPERTVKPTGSRRIRDITFDDIKFEMKKEEPFLRSMLTPKIEKLFGQRIRVRGYIFPSESRELSHFALMPDNRECCFGPGVALYDTILVEMVPEKTAKFTTFMVTVEGTFAFDEVKFTDDDGVTKHVAIYHMVADKVR
jgi:hypothetical protein